MHWQATATAKGSSTRVWIMTMWLMRRTLLLELTDAPRTRIAHAAPDERDERATTASDLHRSPVASGSGGDSRWQLPPAQIVTQNRSLFRCGPWLRRSRLHQRLSAPPEST